MQKNSKSNPIEFNKSQNLLSSNKLFKKVLDNSLNGAAVEDNGKVIFANKAFFKKLGYKSRHEVIGKSPYDFVHKDDLDQLKKALATVQKGKIYKGEFLAVKKDGSTLNVNLEMQSTGDGKNCKNGSFMTFVDEMHLQNSHKELDASEKKYTKLINTINEGLLQTDAAGIITMANQAAAKICEFDSTEQLIGLPMSDLYVKPENRNDFLLKVKNEGVLYNYEFLLKTHNMNKKWTLCTIRALRDDKGDFIGTEGVFRDIHDRKIAQNNLRERNKELELLYKVSEIAEDSFRPLNKILKDIVNILPNSVQYPNYCSARIDYNLKVVESQNYEQTSNNIQANIKSKNKVIGSVTVGYKTKTHEKFDVLFMQEEQRLLQSLAERLGKIIERKEVEKTLYLLNQDLTLTQQIGQIGNWELSEDQFYCSIEMFNILESESETYRLDKKTFLKFVDKENYDYVDKIINKFLSNQEPFGIEFKINTRTGNPKYIKMKGICIENRGQTIFKGTIADITELKTSQIELIESELFNQNIMESSYDCIKILNLDGELLYMSNSGQKLLEIKDIDKFYNKSWIDLWQKEDQSKVRKAIERAKKGQKGTFQAYCPTAKGKPKWWDVIITPINNSAQKVHKLLAISRDITEPKKYEQELQIYKLIADNVQDPMAYLNTDFEYISVNDIYLNYYKMDRENILGQTPADLIGKKFFKNIIKPQLEEVLRGNRVNYEEWVIFPDMEKRYMEMNYYPKLSDSGRVIGIISQGHDKTHEKKLEESILSESKNWNDTVNALDDILLIINRDFTIEKINQKGLDLLRLSEEDVIGRKCYEVIHNENAIKHKCPFQKTLETGKTETIEWYEKVFGKYFSVKSSPVLNDDGNIIKFVDLMRDITPKKRLERSLESSNKKLLMAMKIANQGIWHWNLSGNRLTFDENLLKILGYDDGSPSENPDFWLEQIHEEDRNNVLLHYNKFFEKELKEFNSEFRMKCKDGTYVWLACNSQFFHKHKKAKIVIGVVQDITTKKRAIADLELNQNIVNQSPAVVFLRKNQDERSIDYISDNVKRIFEYTKDEFLSGEIKYIDIIHPDDLERVVSEVEQYSNLHQKDFVHKPYRIITKSGQIKWIEDRTTLIYNPKNEITHYQGIVIDITEIVKIRQNLEFQSMILNQIQDFITATDEKGNITYVNDIVCKTFGKTKKEIIGKNVKIFGDDAKKGETQKNIVKNTMNQGRWRGEVINYTKNGDEIILDFRTQVIKNKFDQHVGMVGISTDITYRKNIEASLKASEKKYKLIANHSNDLIAIMENLKLTYISPSVEKILGYPPEEALDIDFTELFHPDEKAKLLELINNRIVNHNTNPIIISLRIKNKENNYVWLETAIATKIVSEKKWTAIINARDITRRKKAQKALEKRERLLREAQHVGKIGSYETDLKTGLWEGSKEFCLIFGFEYGRKYTQEDFVQIVHPDDRKDVMEYFANCIQKKVDFNYDYRTVNRKTKEVIYVRSMSRIFYTEDGTPYKIFGAKQNITEKKIAQLKLERSQQKYKSIIENMQEVYYRADLDGNFQMLSPSATKVFGYDSLDELLTLNIKKLYKHPENRKNFINALDKQKEMVKFQQTMLKKDGREITILVSSHCFYDKNGDIAGIEGLMLDFTETKQLQDQLSHAQKMESIGQLASGIAHDFNNLLTVIIGYTELLQHQLKLEGEHSEMLKAIFAAGDKAQKLTNQLLAFSRKQYADPKIMNLNTEIKNMQKMLRRLIRENIKIIYDLIDEPTTVTLDSSQFSQIIFNLCVNAKDAMPQGGVLRIAVKEFVFDEEFIKKYHFIRQKGDYIQISVTDTGSGMSPKTKEKIFEPFFTTKGVGEGTGLGLSMVYGVVKQHSGYIIVDSEPGEGSTFNIYFPKAKIDKKDTDKHSKKLFSDKKGKKIMVVEDDDFVRKYMIHVLKYGGYDTIAFSEPVTAIKQFKKISQDIDLLLTDVIMPNMNGKEMYNDLVKIKENLKVVFVSGYPDKALTDIDSKSSNFIQKPIDSEDLLNLINELLT